MGIKDTVLGWLRTTPDKQRRARGRRGRRADPRVLGRSGRHGRGLRARRRPRRLRERPGSAAPLAASTRGADAPPAGPGGDTLFSRRGLRCHRACDRSSSHSRGSALCVTAPSSAASPPRLRVADTAARRPRLGIRSRRARVAHRADAHRPEAARRPRDDPAGGFGATFRLSTQPCGRAFTFVAGGAARQAARRSGSSARRASRRRSTEPPENEPGGVSPARLSSVLSTWPYLARDDRP